MGPAQIDPVMCARFIILNRIVCEFSEDTRTDPGQFVVAIPSDGDNRWTFPTLSLMIISVVASIAVIATYIWFLI